MRFLLVAPRYCPPGFAWPFPLGLGYISASLKQAGYDVHCRSLSFYDGQTEDLIAQAIAEVEPDVFGTGGISPMYPEIQATLAAAKAIKPEMITVAGGGMLTSRPEKVMSLTDTDIGVIGEGEHTIVELAEALSHGGDLSTVEGVIYPDGNGGFNRTAPRPAFKDLDSLPWVDYEGFDLASLLELQNIVDEPFFNYRDDPRVLPMILSRSCPFSCTFCYHPNGKIYRERSLDDFFAEFETRRAQYDINLLNIADELFSMKKRRILEFCEGIAPYNIPWTTQLHVRVIDKEVIAAMKKSGCILNSYGLESANEKILVSMKKKATIEQIENALELTEQHNICIQGNFIFGDPAETLETANDTMDWWSRNRKYKVNLSIMQSYPGAENYDMAMAEGKFADSSETLTQGYFNITGLDDQTIGEINEKVLAFRHSLVVPGKILRFEREENKKPQPFRGAYFRIEWGCPHCSYVNDFRNVLTGAPHHRNCITLTCRKCLKRSEVENLTKKPIRHPDAERMFEEYEELKTQGRSEEALLRLQEIVRTPQKGEHPPDAVIVATLEYAKVLNRAGKNRDACSLMARIIPSRAFDPLYTMTYAHFLLAEGAYSAGKLFAQATQRLTEGKNQKIFKVAQRLEAFAEQMQDIQPGPTFFLGHSNQSTASKQST